jgi:hypothetical protein
VILTILAYSSDKVKDDAMSGYAGCMEEKVHAYYILVGKGREERPYKTPRCKSENSIKTEIKEI